MKIAVSSSGKTLESPVDPRFGRTGGFVLFDTVTGDTVFLDNSAQIGRTQGTGIEAARMIADAGTEVLVTGQMGPKAAEVLKRAGINVYICTAGTVQEAVDAVQRNALTPLGSDMLQAGPGKRGGRGMGGGGRGGGRRRG